MTDGPLGLSRSSTLLACVIYPGFASLISESGPTLGYLIVFDSLVGYSTYEWASLPARLCAAALARISSCKVRDRFRNGLTPSTSGPVFWWHDFPGSGKSPRFPCSSLGHGNSP
jgi:hypothetical protein